MKLKHIFRNYSPNNNFPGGCLIYGFEPSASFQFSTTLNGVT